jgi:hypothetical protein
MLLLPHPLASFLHLDTHGLYVGIEKLSRIDVFQNRASRLLPPEIVKRRRAFVHGIPPEKRHLNAIYWPRRFPW